MVMGRSSDRPIVAFHPSASRFSHVSSNNLDDPFVVALTASRDQLEMS